MASDMRCALAGVARGGNWRVDVVRENGNDWVMDKRFFCLGLTACLVVVPAGTLAHAGANSFAPHAFPRPAIPRNIAYWFNDEDFPADAKKAQKEGTVRFHVTVDSGGRVTSCHINSSIGWPLSDDRTCELISQRARFFPAWDANGQLTNGEY